MNKKYFILILLSVVSFSVEAREIQASKGDTVKASEGSEVIVMKGAKVIIQAGAEVIIQSGARVVLESEEDLVKPSLAHKNKPQNSEGTIEKSLAGIKYDVPNKKGYRLIPDISAIGSIAGAYFTEDPTSNIGHDPNGSGFTMQEIELAIQSEIDPYFRADVYLGFHEEGVEIEEAYLSTLGLAKGLTLRAGKFLVPFGRHNPKHLESWSFADNTLANKSFFGGEGLSELGVEAKYTLPLPFYFSLTGSITNGDNGSSFGGDRKEDLLYAGRAEVSFDLSEEVTLLAGGSALAGFNDSGTGNNTDMFGGDLLIKWKPSSYTSLLWQFEYLYRRMERPNQLLTDGGFYSLVDFQFYRRWHLGLRYDQMGVPDEFFNKDLRLTPMISFDPTEFSRLRLQYEYIKDENQPVEHGLIFQLQFNMGPHGAHPF